MNKGKMKISLKNMSQCAELGSSPTCTHKVLSLLTQQVACLFIQLPCTGHQLCHLWPQIWLKQVNSLPFNLA